MNELVEKMARAAYAAHSLSHRNKPYEKLSAFQRVLWEASARASLSAAHESLKSPEMIRAMVEAHKAACGFGHAAGVAAAIDAAFLGVKVERAAMADLPAIHGEYAIVPREPTFGMNKAAVHAVHGVSPMSIDHIYRAMIQAGEIK